MTRNIEFDIDELNMIFEDQRDTLESSHIGELCNSLHLCPQDHFDLPAEEVTDRQDIMNKILADAEET